MIRPGSHCLFSNAVFPGCCPHVAGDEKEQVLDLTAETCEGGRGGRAGGGVKMYDITLMSC